MRALWIEDHQLIGDSLEVLLQVLMPDVSLDKARNLHAALELVRTFKYEIVLLDWWLGSDNGEMTIAALRGSGCTTPIVIVSADEREEVMRRAQALNVAGYVTKTSDPTALVTVIRQALTGGLVTMTRSNEGGGKAGRQPDMPPLDVKLVFPELTSRQADVFRGLMRGLSDKQIARELGVSETTVKTHVRAILQVVGAHKRGEAVYHARTRGAGES